MSAVVFFVLAAAVGVASAALAWSQARRAASPTGSDPAAFALALKRVPAKDRLEELLRRAAPGSWEHDLAAEALAAPGQDAVVAAVNMALAEAEHALSRGAEWPKAGIRIALLGAAFLAFAAYLSGGGQVRGPLSIVAVGVAAALACVEAGRAARRNAERQRRAIDDLVTVLFGSEAPCRSQGAPRPPGGSASRPRRRARS